MQFMIWLISIYVAMSANKNIEHKDLEHATLWDYTCCTFFWIFAAIAVGFPVYWIYNFLF